MRNFLLALASFFLVFPLISQNLNRSGHTGVDITGEMVAINAKSFYLESIASGCCTSSVSLVCINDSVEYFLKWLYEMSP